MEHKRVVNLAVKAGCTNDLFLKMVILSEVRAKDLVLQARNEILPSYVGQDDSL